MTQREAIISYLKDSKGTVKSMSMILGIQKVSARLSEIKEILEAGGEYELKSRWIDVSSRYGSGSTQVKEYWITRKVAA